MQRRLDCTAAVVLAVAFSLVTRPALAADASWTKLKAKDKGDGKDVVSASGKIANAVLLPEGVAISFRCGTFTQTLPAESLRRTKSEITFRAKQGEGGLQSFSLSLKTGSFTLSAARVELGSLDGFAPFSVEIGGRGLATQHELSRKGQWKSGEPMRATLSVQVLAVSHEAGNVQVAPAAKIRFPGGTGTEAVTIIGPGPITSGPDGRVTATLSFTDPAVLDTLDLSTIFGDAPGMAGSTFSRITAGDDGESQGARFVERRSTQAVTLDPAQTATLDALGGDGAPAGTLTVPVGAVTAPLDGVTFTPLSLGATLPAPLPETYVYAAGAEIAAATATEFVAGSLPSMSLSRPAWADRAAVAAADLRLLRFVGGVWSEVPGRGVYDADTDRIVPLVGDPAKIAGTGVYAYAGKVATPAAKSPRGSSAKGRKPKPKRAIRGRVVTKSGLPLGHQVVLTRSSAVISGADGTYEVAPAALGDLSVEVVQAAGGGVASSTFASGGEALAEGVVVRSPRDTATSPIFHELTGRTTEAGGLVVSPNSKISFTSTSGVRGMLLDDGGTKDNTNDDRLLVPDLSDLGVSTFTWTLSLPGGAAAFVSAVTGPSISPIQAILEAQAAGRTVDAGVASLSVSYDVPAYGEVTLSAGFRIVVDAGAEIADLQLPAAIDGSSRVETVSGADGTYNATFFCLTGLPVVARAEKSGGGSDDTAQIRIELPAAGAQVIDFAFEEVPVVLPPGLPFFDSPRARMPVALRSPMAVALDGNVHVFGGGTLDAPADLHHVYDPITDAWTTRRSLQRPRQFLTGVEFGGFIYAFGGATGATAGTATTAVERYDPATDAWTDVAPMPSGSIAPTSAVVGDKIYALGGQLRGFEQVSVYDTATDTWTTIAPSPRDIMGQGNAILYDGSLYVHTVQGNGEMPVLNIATGTWSLGVADSPQYFISTGTTVVSSQLWNFGVSVFDAVDRVWGPGIPVTPFRRDIAAAAVNGVIYGCGGSNGNVYFDDTNAIRPHWRPRAPMPEAREHPEAVALGSVVYVAGGSLDGASKSNLWTYDTARDNWRIRLPMNSPRERFGLASLNGKLYAVGGSLRETNTPLDTAEVYDPVTGAWTSIAPMSKPRAGVVLGAIGGKLYACGGGDATVESYDPATNTWTPRASMPETRTDAQAVVFGNDLLVFSGSDGTSDRTTVLAYRTTTDTWTVRADEPAVSTIGAAPVLLDGRVFVTGTADTGCARFEPVVGVRDTSGTDPYLLSVRQRHAAVAVNGTIYIFGGATGSAAGSPARRSVESHKPE